MKEDRFIQENSGTWSYLESTLSKLKSKGLKKFSGNELNDFINAYNRTCGHLSYCRTNYGSSDTAAYLNRLVTAAHSYIYTTKTSNLRRLKDFYLKDFPLLLRQDLRFFWISMSLFLLGILVSFIYTLISPDNAAAFLPREILNSIDFGNQSSKAWDGAVMSSYIFTNNIKVGFAAFALGVTLGIGSSYMLIYNGFILGGIAALAAQNNYTLKFWSLILPHGILELFAIFVCGAAGLIIGYSIINPGVYSRKDSFIIKGKTGVRLVCGTIPIFVIAGLIEGFITPSALPDFIKLAFAVFTLALLLFYIIFINVRYKNKA